jgi:hypothetical protein
VNSRKNRLNRKYSILPLKNWLLEMNEITVASRSRSALRRLHGLLDADFFQGQRGSGDVLG